MKIYPPKEKGEAQRHLPCRRVAGEDNSGREGCVCQVLSLPRLHACVDYSPIQGGSGLPGVLLQTFLALWQPRMLAQGNRSRSPRELDPSVSVGRWTWGRAPLPALGLSCDCRTCVAGGGKKGSHQLGAKGGGSCTTPDTPFCSPSTGPKMALDVPTHPSQLRRVICSPDNGDWSLWRKWLLFEWPCGLVLLLRIPLFKTPGIF